MLVNQLIIKFLALLYLFVGAYEVCYNQAKNHSMWSGYVDQNEIRNYRTLVVVREKEAWTNAEITVTVNGQQAQYNPPAGKIYEPVHEISNNVVCATSKASDQPAHTRSLIRAFARRLSIL